MVNKSIYQELVQFILDNQNRFYRLAYSYTRNQEDALDAVQGAVCKALEAFESIRNAGAIKTWFYRILINECFSILKKRKRDALTADFEELDTPYYEQAYDREYVEDELDRLEPDVQEMIKLRFFEEMSLKEIASITGYNLNTVNLDLRTGTYVTLEDLLGSSYESMANEAIRKQITEREEAGEIFFAEDAGGFTGISENTDFYINAKHNPVIVFEKYEIANGAAGEIEFEIGG